MLADTAGRLHTSQPHGGAAQGAPGGRAAAGQGHRGAAWSSTPPPGRTGWCRPRQFTEAVDVTGVVLTKLDGSAKGGIVLAIQTALGIPVKLVGLGETVDDLVPFDPDEFVEALFTDLVADPPGGLALRR